MPEPMIATPIDILNSIMRLKLVWYSGMVDMVESLQLSIRFRWMIGI